MRAGERLQRRISRAEENGTGLRLSLDDAALLAAAARTAELEAELIEYDLLEGECGEVRNLVIDTVMKDLREGGAIDRALSRAFALETKSYEPSR